MAVNAEINDVLGYLTNLMPQNRRWLVADTDPVKMIEISKDDLHKCSYFENLSNSTGSKLEFKTGVSYDSTFAFKEFAETSTITEVTNPFELTAFAERIKWPELSMFCLRNYSDMEIPEVVKLDEIGAVVQAFIKFAPLRTTEHYKAVIQKVASSKLDANNVGRVLQDISTALEARKDSPFDPLPIPLSQNRVTAALVKDMQGNFNISLLNGTEWIPYNFCGILPLLESMKKFHICFGRHIVYEKKEGAVYMMQLPLGRCTKLLDKCAFFRSRCNQLHVVVLEDSTSVVLEWNSDQCKFIERFRLPNERNVSVHSTKDGELAVFFGGHVLYVSSDGQIIEATPYVPAAEIIGDWRLYNGQAWYEKDGKSTTRMNLAYTYHFGYNILETRYWGKYYLIQSHDDVKGHATSGAFSEVISFSDVLLV